MAAELRRLLDPRSIAFVGGRRAALAVAQCDRLGYEGDVWVVNPHATTVGGRAAVPSLDHLPEPPDAVFVGVAADAAVDVVARAAATGAGGAVVYAAGFAETGATGAQRQRRLVEVAADMPIIGPNCHGLVNAMSGAALWPDVHGCDRVERGVAIVTQSGNLAIDLTMQQRALPVAYAITLGNQAVVSLAHCVAVLATDPRVTAIGLHVEGISDSLDFAAAVRAAHDHGTPTVALKTGTTTIGAAIAASHTASLAGSAAAHSALFARFGVAEVRTADELLATLSLLHQHGRLTGRRAMSVSCSGGEASIVADLAPDIGVDFHPFSAATTARLTELLDDRVTVANPLDYHTFIWGDRSRLTDVFTSALGDRVDVGMLVIDFPRSDLDNTDWWPTVDAFADATERTGVPGVVASTLPEGLPYEVCRRISGAGLAPIPGVEPALTAICAAATPPSSASSPHTPPTGTVAGPYLDEALAKDRLRNAGIPVPAGTRASPSSADRAVAELGFPVVVKSLASPHRSDIGGVAVNLTDPAMVQTAVAAMAHLGNELLVERFVDGVVAELLVGVQVDLPVGWTLTIGAGGVLAELLADTRTLLLPTSSVEIADAVESLRLWPILDGYRSGPRAATDAVVLVVDQLARFALEARYEIEVNPLLACADAVWVGDVLMRRVGGSA